MRLSKHFLVCVSLAAVTFMGIGTTMAQDYGMAGCGLGSSLISSDGFMQVFAATTNGSSANQTFGISSGTSNCVEKGVVKVDKEQEAFVEANHDSLQADMAAGGGAYLDGLSELMGCEGVNEEIGALAQANYETLASNDATAFMTLYRLKGEMSMNEELVLACARL